MPKLFLIQFAIKNTLSLDPDMPDRTLALHDPKDYYADLLKEYPKNDVWFYEITGPQFYPEWYGKNPITLNAEVIY